MEGTMLRYAVSFVSPDGKTRTLVVRFESDWAGLADMAVEHALAFMESRRAFDQALCTTTLNMAQVEVRRGSLKDTEFRALEDERACR